MEELVPSSRLALIFILRVGPLMMELVSAHSNVAVYGSLELMSYFRRGVHGDNG